MAIKLTVLMFNPTGPFHWTCQHLAAIATDMKTGKSVDIEYQSKRGRQFHRQSQFAELLDKTKLRNCYVFEYQKLVYFDHTGKIEPIPIRDINKFTDDLNSREIHGSCYLTSGYLDAVITANTGHVPVDTFNLYTNEKNNPLDYFAKSGSVCTSITTLYSDKNFDEFVASMKSKFVDYNYSWSTNNCADAVNFALNELFPDKGKTELSFFIYRSLCCPLFFGSLGLSCFPAPPCACTTPQDIFDKARWLAMCTSYGTDFTQIKDISELPLKVLSESKLESKQDLPSAPDSMSMDATVLKNNFVRT